MQFYLSYLQEDGWQRLTLSAKRVLAGLVHFDALEEEREQYYAETEVLRAEAAWSEEGAAQGSRDLLSCFSAEDIFDLREEELAAAKERRRRRLAAPATAAQLS